VWLQTDVPERSLELGGKIRKKKDERMLPLIARHVEVMEQIYQRIRNNRKIITDETASEMIACQWA
jgi:hypothetical protein